MTRPPSRARGCSSPLNPIVLYEYGRHLARRDACLIVGVDPEYPRKQDVVMQARLATNCTMDICPDFSSFLGGLIIAIQYFARTQLRP